MPRIALAALLALLLLASTAHAAGPGRVVALTPFTANVLAQLGVASVAVGEPGAGEEALDPRLRNVRRLTLSHPNGPNLEQLVTLRPDAVFSSPIWRAGT